jgi:uncharacterized membrane protein
MTQLVVIGFDTTDEAREILKTLRDLERQGQIAFEDTAIVSRDSDGTTHVQNEVSGTTETAAVIGAFIGGLLGFLFPLAGIAIGAAAGAAIGASLEKGVPGDFVDDLKKTLEPGRSALFLVVKDADADTLLAALRQFHGDIIQTTLSSDIAPEHAVR